MEQNQKQPELIEYQILNLPDSNLDNFANQPVEIRGQAPLVLVTKIFSELRKICPEVIYPNTIIVSPLNPDEYLYPRIIKLPVNWTEEELIELEKKQDQDQSQEIKLNLEELWTGDLKKYLQKVYSFQPEKEQVELQGEIPVLPVLLTVNWFKTGKSKEIIINQVSI